MIEACAQDCSGVFLVGIFIGGLLAFIVYEINLWW